MSVFVIVNTAANYYKHHVEWPANWATAVGQQRVTIEDAIRCGMQPGWFSDNLLMVFNLLNADLGDIASKIADWRHRLAADLYKDLQLEKPNMTGEGAAE
jgi:hypothetical protein